MNDEKPTHLDIFAGIGGFSIAAQEAGFVTVGHAEVERFACAVYHRHFPKSLCFGGVENVTRSSVLERCGGIPTVVTGGFPCQPHSLAGERRASADDRDLWGECRRVVGDLRPQFALFENVRGLLTSERGLFFNRILSDMAELRYSCIWQIVSAAAVGAPHRRERVWILCVDELADGEGRQRDREHVRQGDSDGDRRGDRAIVGAAGGRSGDLADADGAGRGELRGTFSTRSKLDAAEHGGLAWPAIRGLWPSRPGQKQFGWEPPRVVAHAPKQREQRDTDGARAENGSARNEELGGGSKGMGDADSRRFKTSDEGQLPISFTDKASPDKASPDKASPDKASPDKASTQPALGGVSDGLPAAMGGTWPEVHNRVGQLKGYGNAIVPACAMIFFRAIIKEIRRTA